MNFFSELTQFIQTNYPGYIFKHNKQIHAFEKKHSKLILKNNLGIISKYLNLFEDKHLFIKYKYNKINNQFIYKSLPNNIDYVKISNFNNVEIVSNLTKVIKANKNKFLIIDLRNNNGGLDTAWQSFLPLIFPLKPSEIALPNHKHLITPTNVKLRLELLKNKISNENYNQLEKELQGYLNKKVTTAFIGHKKKYYNASIEGSEYPKKVIIFSNENTGSSAEYFIYLSKQSSKVTIIGNSTTGAFDYGNACYYKILDIDKTIQYPTSYSILVEKNKGIDKTGIKPDVYVNDNELLNWALEYLK